MHHDFLPSKDSFRMVKFARRLGQLFQMTRPFAAVTDDEKVNRGKTLSGFNAIWSCDGCW